MTDDDLPTTELPRMEPNPSTPSPLSPPASPGLRPWMWIVPGVVVVAVAAFFGGRAVASSASAPSVQTAGTMTTSVTPSSSTPESGPPTAGGSGGVKTGRTGKAGKVTAASVVGTIQSMSGAIWTVKKADGSTVQVTIISDTRYGTKARPETVADFKIGTKVLVATAKSAVGQKVVTAKRVVSRMKSLKKADPVPSTAPTTA